MMSAETASDRRADVLTVDQAAELLQLSAPIVRQLASRSELPGRRMGKRTGFAWRFSRKQLIEFVEAGERVKTRGVETMKNIVAGVAACLLASAASAQITTLDYTGSTMTGTVTSMQANSFVQNPITGFYTAELVIQGGVLSSYSAMFYGSNGAVLPMETFAGAFVSGGPGPVWSGPSAEIDFNGGAPIFGFTSTNYNGSNMSVSLGADDSFSYLWGHNGTCAAQIPTYPDGTAYSNTMCAVSVSAPTPGTWSVVGAAAVVNASASTAAPEMDPAGAMGALLLLAGGLAVLRGRRNGQLK
jgi:excisionase family DNA binding protein